MKRFLLLWLVGAVLIAVGIGSISIPLLYSLVRRGVPTCGTVTGREPANHNSVHYFYEVDGKTYVGVQQGGAGGQSADYSTDCMGYVVYYLPQNPQRSCIGQPGPMLTNEIVPITLAMLSFPPIALFAWRRRYPAFRKWLEAGHKTSGENQSLTST
jgi:hypothetical protein